MHESCYTTDSVLPRQEGELIPSFLSSLPPGLCTFVIPFP